MIGILRLAILAAILALPVSAWGQSTAAPVSPGSETTVGCPGSFLSCWKPYSSTNPLPVGPGSIAYTASTTGTVGTSSGTLVAAGTYGGVLQICTLPTSTTNVWLNIVGGTAVANSGMPVAAGGGCAYFGPGGPPVPTAAITAITDGAVSQDVAVMGG